MIRERAAVDALVSELACRAGASDGAGVLREAARMAGFGYRITREQQVGLVDCSSLVAQAHWFGAAVGTPFIAETQRVAYNATDVTRLSRRVADVMVRWPSRAESPGGRHNHVALYLGRDDQGDDWLLESADEIGVRAARFDEAAWALGGVRRFLPVNGSASPAAHVSAIQMARGVPKLGRLGARLTSGASGTRRHRGVDIFLRESAPVYAPIAGRLRRADGLGVPHGAMAMIECEHALVLLGPIEPATAVDSDVSAGDPVGVAAAQRPPLCNTLPTTRGDHLLHFELWAKELPFPAERGQRLDRRPDLSAFNPLLAVRIGLVAAPLRAEAAVRDMRPRWVDTSLLDRREGGHG